MKALTLADVIKEMAMRFERRYDRMETASASPSLAP
jgi:hypothetical protein